MKRPPRIAIVGGGPAGLVLARVLSRGGVPATVLERDDGPDARTQGGSLDLHPESGQRALAVAGLIEQFHRYARPQGDEIRILDPSGREHVRHGGDTGSRALEPGADGILPGRPEIDRAELRRLLLESLPEGVVRWGQRVTDVQRVPTGGLRLGCADGSSTEWDVVIGADGAHSLVRPLLTDVVAQPLGVTAAWMWVHDLGARADLADLIGAGSLWCLGNNLIVGAQRGGHDDARVSVMARDTGNGPPIPSNATKADLLDLIADWAPAIRDLVVSAGDEVTVHEVETLPVGLCWSTRPGVTLIGDAAHLMPPVGEGANQAMLDAAELGRALLASPDAPAEAIAATESAMFARIRPVAGESARMQAAILAPDALDTMTRMFGG